MLTINILPNKIKKEISIKKTLKIFIEFSILILILIVLIVGIIYASKLFLNSYLKTVEKSVMINKMGKNFNDDIKNIEDEIENITNIQNEHINYLYILDNIISKIGNEISISQLKIDGTKNEIIMSGYANTRDSLLILKNQFEEDKIYSNIDLPLDSLLEKTNINFNIKMNFKIK